jgi:Fe-S-cluster containining protein
MLLSNADIRRLENRGAEKQSFVSYDGKGYAQLRNDRGFCVFYDRENKRCKIYKLRPQGCQIYPVVYSEEDGVIVDYLCPMVKTVSKNDLETKGKSVIKLLRKIDEEAKARSNASH